MQMATILLVYIWQVKFDRNPLFCILQHFPPTSALRQIFYSVRCVKRHVACIMQQLLLSFEIVSPGSGLGRSQLEIIKRTHFSSYFILIAWIYFRNYKTYSRFKVLQQSMFILSHSGRVTYICISKQITIGSDNGLLPDQRQAIIWTNAEIMLIAPIGTNLSEILIKIYTFSFKKMHLKMSSGECWRFCLGLNVLNN